MLRQVLVMQKYQISNFFINSKNASFENMYNLINFVKEKVKKKTGITLELELEIVN